MKRLGPRQDFSRFLGGWAPAKDGDVGKWKPDMMAIRATIKYVDATYRWSEED